MRAMSDDTPQSEPRQFNPFIRWTALAVLLTLGAVIAYATFFLYTNHVATEKRRAPRDAIKKQMREMPGHTFQLWPTRPNHALQRTRPSHHGCNPRVPRAGSLSLGR